MAHLREVPVALQRHDVVVHLHVGVEDLTGARIDNAWTNGVLHRRRQPAHHRYARIFATEFRIVRRIFGDNSVTESRFLERPLPLFDALLHPRLCPQRRRRIHIVCDRLHRLADGGVRILLFKPPAVDEHTIRYALLTGSEILRRSAEPDHAFVPEPRLHWHIGQLDDRKVVELSRRAGRRCAAESLRCGSRAGGRREGL